MANLSKEEKLELTKRRVREAFILFEHKEGSRQVDIKDVPTVVRSLGVNPTAIQVMSIVDQLAAQNVEDNVTSMIHMEAFTTIVSQFLIQQEAALFRDDYSTLLRAFRAFDPDGKGYVEADQLKPLLMARGETMAEDEVGKMMAFAADDQGRIYYEDYAQRLATDGRSI